MAYFIKSMYILRFKSYEILVKFVNTVPAGGAIHQSLLSFQFISRYAASQKHVEFQVEENTLRLDFAKGMCQALKKQLKFS